MMGEEEVTEVKGNFPLFIRTGDAGDASPRYSNPGAGGLGYGSLRTPTTMGSGGGLNAYSSRGGSGRWENITINKCYRRCSSTYCTVLQNRWFYSCKWT